MLTKRPAKTCARCSTWRIGITLVSPLRLQLQCLMRIPPLYSGSPAVPALWPAILVVNVQVPWNVRPEATRTSSPKRAAPWVPRGRAWVSATEWYGSFLVRVAVVRPDHRISEMPEGPWIPCCPVPPAAPLVPSAPAGPRLPCSPAGPCGPGSPGSPAGPGGPHVTIGPGFPGRQLSGPEVLGLEGTIADVTRGDRAVLDVAAGDHAGRAGHHGVADEEQTDDGDSRDGERSVVSGRRRVVLLHGNSRCSDSTLRWRQAGVHTIQHRGRAT